MMRMYGHRHGHRNECGCGGSHAHGGGHRVGFTGFPTTQAEEIEELRSYLNHLKNEADAMEKRIKELEGGVRP